MRFTLVATLLCPFALAACQPPAADSYEGRADPPDTTSHASEPQGSPDAQGAVWAPSGTPLRLLYGIPGEQPFVAVACEMSGGDSAELPLVRITRFARADEGAQALMALVGNGHKERVGVEAVDNGRAFLWQGTLPLASEKLDVLTGQRKVELTIPGAGTVALNASEAPRDLIETCRVAVRQSARKQSPDQPENSE